MDDIKNYVAKHKDRFIEELIGLLELPSISADPSHKTDMMTTAQAVKERLQEAGCDHVEVRETPGQPIVYGETIRDESLPTILVYGHYDVQPPDPVELWEHPPFEPVIKQTKLHPEGAIYARGASDDKGQMFMHLKALEYMTRNNKLPCNVKFMIEGEEEVGSEHLEWFVKQNREKLANDVVLISDTGMISRDIPSITTGLRGLSYVEVEITGPNRDLHSGLYGGAVANPLNILAKMIAGLHDENNLITIPGFYDMVEELSEKERTKMTGAPFDLNGYKEKLGIDNIHGEKAYSTLERASVRPSLDVNGIWGGYTGKGAKTVLPSKAYAKISMRLVPNQDWKKISELFKTHFESIAPKSVRVKVSIHHGGQPYVTPIDTLEYRAANNAFEESFRKTPVPQRSGGSIPIVSLFEKELKSKTVLMGFGLDTDAIHSPNEHFGIWNFLKGIETIPLFYKHFAKLKKEA